MEEKIKEIEAQFLTTLDERGSHVQASNINATGRDPRVRPQVSHSQSYEHPQSSPADPNSYSPPAPATIHLPDQNHANRNLKVADEVPMTLGMYRSRVNIIYDDMKKMDRSLTSKITKEVFKKLEELGVLPGSDEGGSRKRMRENSDEPVEVGSNRLGKEEVEIIFKGGWGKIKKELDESDSIVIMKERQDSLDKRLKNTEELAAIRKIDLDSLSARVVRFLLIRLVWYGLLIH